MILFRGTRPLFLALFASSIVFAQTPAQSSALAALRPAPRRNRIAASPDLVHRVPLAGQLPAWAAPANESAQPVDLTQTLHLTFVLRRDPAAEAAFEQFLADQQTPGSPLYHQWLTPQQVGTLFGPTQTDVDAIVAWATSQGFALTGIQPNRVLLDFETTLGTAASAFHTSFAHFNLNSRAGNTTRLSIVSEPTIPEAFAAVVESIGGLVESRFEPQSRVAFQAIPDASGPHPQATFSSGSIHFLSPNDFDTIYDLTSVQSGGNTGATIGSATQRVAVIGRSRVTSSDITTFESVMGLPSKLPNVVLAGTDPGISADADEQTLDVQRVIGTAPGAQVDLVLAASIANRDGVNTALAYNINTLLDPVMTISYGSCEANDGSSATASLNSMFQTAAAEGITTLISSGDSGAAGCDTSFTAAPASQAASVNALCASPYVTCVGGTEFNDTTSPSSYWASSNGAGYSSALSTIPEGAWNEPNGSPGYIAAATGGGASIYIAKPSWQTGAGVPADGRRDVPDVAFSAADHDGYLGCDTSNGDTATCTTGSQGFSVAIFSGTSAAAPGMAGIVALLNTRLGSAQGNINPLLYSLAASTPAAFHDVTPTSSGIGAACATATPSMCNNSTPGPSSLTGGLAGYALTTGYDQATGLGSLDVAKLLAAASAPVTAATTLVLSAPTPNPATVGQSVSLTATLTPATSTHTPTDTVQFYAALGTAAATAIGGSITLSANSATLMDTFTTAGSYTITAIYSGDTNFASSTAPGVALTVNLTSFTLTPAVTTIDLVSGATLGNTDAITLASANSFAGAVDLGCTVTNRSGTAAGTCAIAPASVALTAGSRTQSTLTLTTTPGTAGVLSVVVTGSSGGTTISSSNLTVNLTAASFTLAAVPSNIAVASGVIATSTLTLTSVNGFAGTIALACTGSLMNGTTTTTTPCSTAPASVVLTSGGTAIANVSIPTSGGGSLTATLSGTGTTSGATLASTASTQVTVSVTVPGLTLTAAPASLSFTSGATASNTSTLTLTPVNGFAGPVVLNCSLTSSTAGYPPTCALAPQSVTLAANGTATAVLSISSTTTHNSGSGLQAALARTTALLAMLLCFPAFRRRRTIRNLLAAIVLLGGLGLLSGCNSGSTAAPQSLQSSAGNYTATVTASGASTGSATAVSATTTIAVTIH